jgi:hypothetical protein
MTLNSQGALVTKVQPPFRLPFSLSSPKLDQRHTPELASIDVTVGALLLVLSLHSVQILRSVLLLLVVGDFFLTRTR